jgi:alpha-ketoglutarate-dependent taurine dioxygenase
MTPQNSSAKYVFEILKDIPFQNKLTHKIFWNGNNILIIDNWRILHRREKVDQLEYDSRKIQRIYVG